MSTAIEFEDIRVGDRVRRTVVEARDVTINELTVTDVTALGPVRTVGTITGRWYGLGFAADATWELIERPKPDPKPGQIWYDPTVFERYLTVGTVDREGGIRLITEDGFFIVIPWPGHFDRLVYIGEAYIGEKGAVNLDKSYEDRSDEQ